MIKNKSETENKYKQTVKENEKLQEKIKQLTLFQDNIEKDLNEINLKYKETKKILSEKEKELFDLKEASQALIQKEKNHMEQSITVDPNKCKIITDKIYKKLKWYLIYEKKEKDEKKENNDKNDNNINKEDEENKYENYRWVEGPIIKRKDLQKFNKYETDEEKIKDLNEYIINLQKKLEEKEDQKSKLDLKNKKLIQDIHNKTAGHGTINPLSRKSSNNKNASIDVGADGFNNILEELNKSNARERQLQNTIKKLNSKLNENKNDNLNQNNENDEKKEDDKNNLKVSNDYSEPLKLAQEQMALLKDELKETKTKLEQLIGQVKELLKNVKCDNKNKPQFVQICQILNLSPQTTNRIITNNNKKGMNF